MAHIGDSIARPLNPPHYFQANRLSDSIEGAGIGLTIAARIARLHAAQIQLAFAEQGAGLAVHIQFPLAPE